MQLHELQRNTPNKKSRQVGRGGKRGKTAGRGTKGQRARAGHSLRPELRDIIKKLPKMRGRGKNSNLPLSDKPVIVNLIDLERGFGAGEVVSPKTLQEKGLIRRIDGKLPAVKILGRGALSKKLSVSGCLVSEVVRGTIEKAGGEVR